MKKIETRNHLPIVQDASWPECCPKNSKSAFLTVISGNSHCKFAWHDPIDLQPKFFWRIPFASLNTKNSKKKNQEDDKNKFLQSIPYQSPEAQALWKPPQDCSSSSSSAILTRSHIYQYRMITQRDPMIYIYFISTNDANEQQLYQWFSALPVRLIRLSYQTMSSHLSQQVPYPTFGMDRFVATQGILVHQQQSQQRRPTLIVDGGTALTTTIVDSAGTIVGGTISPGLFLQYRSLQMGHLPAASQSINTKTTTSSSSSSTPTPQTKKINKKSSISTTINGTHDEFMQFTSRTEPLPWFATNTRDAIWNGIVRGIALYLRAIVKRFVEQYQTTTTSTDQEDNDHKNNVQIYVTGSDGPLLLDLLHPEQCHRLLADMPLENDLNSLPSTSAPPKIEHVPHLLHQGISYILQQEQEQHQQQSEQEIQSDLLNNDTKWIGLRVARNVGRGFVEHVDIVKGLEEAVFHIVYDHGNHTEALGLLAFYDALERYSAVGDHPDPNLELYQSAIEERKKESKQAANQLIELCPSVAEYQKSRPPKVYHDLNKDMDNINNGLPPAVETSIMSPMVMLDAHEAVTKSKGKRKRGRPKTASTQSPKIDRRRKKDRNQLPIGVDPMDYIQRRIAKFFGDEEIPYYGTVESYSPTTGFWKIAYDDGDSEEMEFHEIMLQFKCYEENAEKTIETQIV